MRENFRLKMVLRSLIGGICVVGLFGLFGCGKKSALNKVQSGQTDIKSSSPIDARLISYEKSSSGGMSGGYSSEKVWIDEDEIHIAVSSSEWWNEDPTVSEYLVEEQALNDIEKVFKENNMQDWVNVKFTDEFIDDGPSYQHLFLFDDGTRIVFSSQSYPGSYGDKLAEIAAIIDEYKIKGVLLNS